jgi:hypothetical protein
MLGTVEAAIAAELRSGSSRRRRGCGIAKEGQRRLANDILHVATGLRPAFLFDHGDLATDRLQRVLDALQERIPVVSRLVLLLMSEDDYVVINVALLLAKMKADLANGLLGVMLVDISPTLSKPKECSAEFKMMLLEHFKKYHERVAIMSSDHCSQAQVPTEVPLPTLVGWLLDYPALYCWEGVSKSIDQLFTCSPPISNCLAQQPLLVSCIEVFR